MDWNLLCNIVRGIDAVLCIVVAVIMTRNADRDNGSWGKAGNGVFFFFFEVVLVMAFGFGEKVVMGTPFAFSPFAMFFVLLIGIRSLIKTSGISIH